MKLVNEILGKIKGDDKVNDIMTGKNAFSQQTFGETVSALINDSTFKIPTYDKNTGEKNGEVCISDLVRSDFKATAEKAKYPQKSEEKVYDSTEIVTKGIAKAIPYIVNEYIKCGKKFDLPQQPTYGGSIYLAKVDAKEKVVKVRDPKTQADLGTAKIKTQPYVQVRAKSPVPNQLQTKERYDANGKKI